MVLVALAIENMRYQGELCMPNWRSPRIFDVSLSASAMPSEYLPDPVSFQTLFCDSWGFFELLFSPHPHKPTAGLSENLFGHLNICLILRVSMRHFRCKSNEGSFVKLKPHKTSLRPPLGYRNCIFVGCVVLAGCYINIPLRCSSIGAAG